MTINFKINDFCFPEQYNDKYKIMVNTVKSLNIFLTRLGDK